MRIYPFSSAIAAWIGCALVLVLAVLPAQHVFAYEESVPRYALVVGNSNYKFSPLKNPANDAEDVAE